MTAPLVTTEVIDELDFQPPCGVYATQPWNESEIVWRCSKPAAFQAKCGCGHVSLLCDHHVAEVKVVAAHLPLRCSRCRTAGDVVVGPL